MNGRELLRSVLALVLLAGVLWGVAPSDVATAAPGCGRFDHPESGIPGDVPLADQLSGRADDGYNCGLSLIGYNSLGRRGGNANMAWAGECAYVSGSGIAVVDVTDPTHPRHVTTLHGPGSSATVETLHAMVAPDRAILVAGRYGFYGQTGLGSPAPVDVYDVRDCRNPVLLSTFSLPWNVHNLTLSADAKTMWSTLPVQAADLTDPRNPKPLPNLEDELKANGVTKIMYSHEAWPTPDGKRLYIGGQMAGDEEMLLIDIEHWPERPAKVVGRFAGPGHSIRPATIGGKSYLLHSDESIINPTAKGCVPEFFTPVGSASQPYLTDISDETKPTTRGKFRLPINEPSNCVEQVLSQSNSSVHYHDVDDPDDTTFALASMWNAGLRIIDVRDPAQPREVAYFNPGRFQIESSSGGGGIGTALAVLSPNQLDQAWAHSRYVPETGHIWLTTRSGGFWVLELQPQVRRALDLPERPAHFPDGTDPRPPETNKPITATDAALYCIVDGVGSVLAGAVTDPVRFLGV
ncbi:MAG: hypothetical protein M3Z03_02525 [Actinomycetota bacterium]|nr:hypothetical protein [Actinomycetota bacterium]